jgi:uncharacterized protein YycO
MTNVVPLLGDFGLTQIHGDVGKLIRFGQWLNGDGFADFEHAFIYVGDGNIIEAEPGGARKRPYSEYSGNTILWSTGHCKLNFGQRTSIARTAQALVGTPYSFVDYLALLMHRFHVPAPYLQRYIQTSDHMICSQLVDLCYQSAGVKLFNDGRWNGDVTPGDLYGLLK